MQLHVVLSVSLLVLVAPVLGFPSQRDSCTAAQQQQIVACYTPFFAAYNFTLNATGAFPKYWDFHPVRENLLVNDGLNIQGYVCDAGNALVNCLQPLQSCMDSLVYTHFNLDANNSLDYWQDLYVTKFQCGDGYSVLTKEFYCLGATRAAHSSELDACTNAMNAALPNATNPCNVLNTFVTCESNIYTAACAKDAGWFMCGNNEAGINAVSPACQQAGLLIDCNRFK